MSLGTSAASATDPVSLNAELESVRRRFGHLGLVDAKLGQGAMGGVYRIVREGRPYALKVLLPKTLSDESSVKRFHLEGNLLAKLDHPNILKVHEVGTCGDWPYLISELVDGGSVDELAAQGPMGWDQALTICESLLEALGEVHKGKIYHRDIKPSNVLLTRDKVVKLADFGIAKANEGMGEVKKTTTGIILGTPAYIAPEVLKGKPADARSDLYAVGVLLFELMAGRLPWDESDPNGFLVARLQQTEPPRLVDYVPSIPRTIDALVQTALNDNPVDRYPTAATFLKALRITRDRLVTTQVGKASLKGTAVMSSVNLEVSAPAAVHQTVAEHARAMPQAGPRVTASRLKRPVAPLRTAPAEPPSRVGPVAIGVAAAFGVVLVFSIMMKRPPPQTTQTLLTGAATQVVLMPDEQNAVSSVMPLLVSDASGKMAAGHLKAIAGWPSESAARTLFMLSQQSPLREIKILLTRTRTPLAVEAAVFLLADPGAGPEVRLEAARALLEITDRFPSPATPGIAAQKLAAFLIAVGDGEPREVLGAAIQTIGWYRDPMTPPSVIKAMRAAPDKAGWVGGVTGFPDPSTFLRKAFEAIDNPAAREERLRIPEPTSGKRSFDRLNPKTP